MWTIAPRSTTISRIFELSIVCGEPRTDISSPYAGASRCGSWHYQGIGLSRARSRPMSIFPTRILLATDGSREAQLAASTAADLANTTNSELHVLTVAPGNPDPVYHIHEGGCATKPINKRSKP